MYIFEGTWQSQFHNDRNGKIILRFYNITTTGSLFFGNVEIYERKDETTMIPLNSFKVDAYSQNQSINIDDKATFIRRIFIRQSDFFNIENDSYYIIQLTSYADAQYSFNTWSGYIHSVYPSDMSTVILTKKSPLIMTHKKIKLKDAEKLDKQIKYSKEVEKEEEEEEEKDGRNKDGRNKEKKIDDSENDTDDEGDNEGDDEGDEGDDAFVAYSYAENKCKLRRK